MGVLKQAAEAVRTSWCKGDIRREDISRESGDTYCAVGALASCLIGPEMSFTYDGEKFGPTASVNAWNNFIHDLATSDETLNLVDEMRIMRTREDDTKDFVDTYEFINNSIEGYVLAKVIFDNYKDRLISVEEDEEFLSTDVNTVSSIIFGFNDHEDTTREDVIAMMEKADLFLEEMILAREVAEDELVEDIEW